MKGQEVLVKGVGEAILDTVKGLVEVPFLPFIGAYSSTKQALQQTGDAYHAWQRGGVSGVIKGDKLRTQQRRKALGQAWDKFFDRLVSDPVFMVRTLTNTGLAVYGLAKLPGTIGALARSANAAEAGEAVINTEKGVEAVQGAESAATSTAEESSVAAQESAGNVPKPAQAPAPAAPPHRELPVGVGAARASGSTAEPGIVDSQTRHIDVNITPEDVAALGGASRPIPATASSTNAAGAPDQGVYFFGEDVRPLIDKPDATLGRAGDAHFFSPLEDVSSVQSASDAMRASGQAPSVTQAYVTKTPVYGVSFPTEGLEVRLPTTADAGGNLNFLPGGKTAMRLSDESGYLLNQTREFVTPGGGPIPKGAVLFQLGPNGDWIPIRRY